MRKVTSTDSGMYGLWDATTYSAIDDYDSWDRFFGEDQELEQQIAAGAFVPINIRSDGVAEIDARVGDSTNPVVLSERERKYLGATAQQPYLLVTSGVAHFGGIEHVGGDSSPSRGEIILPPGKYSVMIHMIDWPSEPGMLQADDKPAPNALPDFVLLINPDDQTSVHRRSVHTFEP